MIMCPIGEKNNEERTERYSCKGMPGDFNNMKEMMQKCCPDMGQIPECSDMMKIMTEKLFGSKKKED